MKKYQIEIKWAPAFVLMTLLWMWIEKGLGLHSQHIDQHAVYTNLIAIPAIAIYVSQEQAESYFNLRNYIQQGLIGAPIMGLITTVIVAFFTRTKSKHTVGIKPEP